MTEKISWGEIQRFVQHTTINHITSAIDEDDIEYCKRVFRGQLSLDSNVEIAPENEVTFSEVGDGGFFGSLALYIVSKIESMPSAETQEALDTSYLFVIDLSNFVLKFGNRAEVVKVTYQQMELLKFMAEKYQSGTLVSKEDIISGVWPSYRSVSRQLFNGLMSTTNVVLSNCMRSSKTGDMQDSDPDFAIVESSEEYYNFENFGGKLRIEVNGVLRPKHKSARNW